ncbi:hypothetical protein GCM10009775_04740 [Microbacterium aoyamense]|uniref:Uncharacterized protein n=1 Tax=Microbacterium aoyamense TaxID=344166 RepID=A0ABN2PBU7_9MICO
MGLETKVGAFADAVILRQQILGYVDNPDELFLPLVSDEDSSRDGYYRLLGASVTPHAAAYFDGVVYAELELERVLNFQAPLIEIASVGAIRTNAHGITTAAPRSIGFPSGATDFVEHAASGSTFMRIEDQDRGAASVQTGSASRFDGACSWLYMCEPEDFYNGAATILFTDDLLSTPDVVQTGRPAGVHLGSSVKLSNDLVTFESAMTNPLSPRWVWRITVAGLPTVEFFPTVNDIYLRTKSLVVLRNSPEAVAIRVRAHIQASPTIILGNVEVTFNLRRGDRMVSAHMVSSYGAPKVESTMATSSQTNGGIITAVTSGSALFASPVAIGVASGKFSPTSVNQEFPLGFGAMLSSSPDTAAEAIASYFWASEQRQSVVVP